jgi:hypothetical protein
MDSEKSIKLIRELHKNVNDKLFSTIFGLSSSNLLKTWYLNEQNTIEFLRILDRDSKIKFWNWIKTLGVVNLDSLRESYSIISVIYKALCDFEDNENPMYEILNKYPLDNMVIFIISLTEKEIDTLIDWCQTWLIDAELEKAKVAPIIFYNKKVEVENKADLSINLNPTKLKAKTNPFEPQIMNRSYNIAIRKYTTTPRYVSLNYKLTLPKPNILDI